MRLHDPISFPSDPSLHVGPKPTDVHTSLTEISLQGAETVLTIRREAQLFLASNHQNAAAQPSHHHFKCAIFDKPIYKKSNPLQKITAHRAGHFSKHLTSVFRTVSSRAPSLPILGQVETVLPYISFDVRKRDSAEHYLYSKNKPVPSTPSIRAPHQEILKPVRPKKIANCPKMAKAGNLLNSLPNPSFLDGALGIRRAEVLEHSHKVHRYYDDCRLPPPFTGINLLAQQHRKVETVDGSICIGTSSNAFQTP